MPVLDWKGVERRPEEDKRKKKEESRKKNEESKRTKEAGSREHDREGETFGSIQITPTSARNRIYTGKPRDEKRGCEKEGETSNYASAAGKQSNIIIF